MVEKPKTITFVALVLISVWGQSPACGWELSMPVLWRTDLSTLLESTAVAADINADGLDEIVAAGREELFALDGTGKVLWQWRTKGRFMTYPAVFHAPDHKAFLYAADSQGQLTCLDGSGHVVWQVQLKGPSVWSGSAVDTLEPDGPPLVIQADATGLVSALDAAKGRVVWQTQVQGAPSTPAVADLNGDGRKEVVVVTDSGALFALGSSGALLWSQKTNVQKPSWAVCAPVVFQAADGKSRIVAAAGDNTVACWDAQGQICWTRDSQGGVASSLSVGDFDGDGRCDIFLATQLGVIDRYTEDGQLCWRIEMQGRSLAPGAILDINNDGRMEYVLCAQDGCLTVLGQSGELLFQMQFPHRTIGVTPAFGQFVKGSKTLQAAITGGESGLLVCLDTPALEQAVAQWPLYRRDARNTGSWTPEKTDRPASMSPTNLAAQSVLSGEEVSFAIRVGQPPANALLAQATCIAPDGFQRTSISRVLGTQGELRLPVDWSLPGLYRFSWSLAKGDDTKICAGIRNVRVRPFENEMCMARSAVDELSAAAQATQDTLPHTAAALRNNADSLSRDLVQLEPTCRSASEGDTAARDLCGQRLPVLVQQSRRAARFAELFKQPNKLPAGTSLLAFQATMWENRLVDAQMPVEALRDLTVNRRLVRGERDAVSVMLLNITNRELLVRVNADPRPDQSVDVDLLHSEPVPTSLGETSWDPLPPLGESRTLSIPPLESRELWFDVDASRAAPGPQNLSFVAQSLNGASVLNEPASPQSVPPAETKIQLQYTILPFEMAPPGAFRLCAWADPTGGDWQDLLAHGNNVFTAPLPEARRNAKGKLAPSDFSKLDAVLENIKGHDVVTLLQGMPNLQGAVGSEAYVAELKVYLEDLIRHMAQKGQDASHFALYPIDEPGGIGWNGVNSYVAFGKAVRAANPAILIYMNGGCELPMCEAMKPVTDIWTPSIYGLPEDSEVMRTIRGSGKTLWSYNCEYAYARPVGPNLKNVNIVAEYRNAALFALNYGATGIGFWCYDIGDDPWTRTAMEYALVYPGQDKPVASRRWKAVRESIEDARILLALKQQAAGGQNSVLCEKLRKLAQEGLPAIMNQSYRQMRLGLARYVLDATNNDDAVQSLRDALMDCAALAADQAKPVKNESKLSSGS